MWPHRTQSVCAAVRSCFFLFSILVTTTALSIASLRKDTLLCHFCPLQLKSKSCLHVTTTRCLPDEVCANSRGYNGAAHVVSAQGCVKRHLCGGHEFKFRLGVRYKVSHTCCCKDKCNHYLPVLEESLKLLQGMIQAAKNVVNVTTSIVQEQPFDSCANYKSPPMLKNGK